MAIRRVDRSRRSMEDIFIARLYSCRVQQILFTRHKSHVQKLVFKKGYRGGWKWEHPVVGNIFRASSTRPLVDGS